MASSSLVHAWHLLVLAIVTTACSPGPKVASSSDSMDGKVVSPKAPFESFDRAPIDSILRYAESLKYDEDVGVTDRQALAVLKPDGKRCPEGCTYGPVASIQPQVDAAFLSLEELKAGRVIARFVNEDTLAYEKLNLSAKSTTYYVVVNTGGPQWTGYFVSADPARGSLSRVPHPIYIDAPHDRYSRSTARWIWVAEDEQAWVSCNSHCCKTGP